MLEAEKKTLEAQKKSWRRKKYLEAKFGRRTNTKSYFLPCTRRRDWPKKHKTRMQAKIM